MSLLTFYKKVFRYSALGLGVVYGFTHRYSLKSAALKKEADDKLKNTEKLIAEAKEEYAKLNNKGKDSSSTDLSKINLDDKNLDFAKVILGSLETLK